MITKQTTSTQPDRRIAGAADQRQRNAVQIGLVAGTLLIAMALFARRVDLPAQPAAPADQPLVGRSVVVTGLVFDGTRYISTPIAPMAPRAGHGYAVTALVYDGTTYRTAPVPVQRTALLPVSSSSGWPGATLTGSAYNGQSAHTIRLDAPSSSGWPGATLTGSAYNGQ